MKHILRYVFPVMALSAGLASCSKEQAPVALDEAVAVVEKIETDFQVFLPEAEKTSVNFSDGGKVLWTTDDPVMVSDGTNATTMYVKQGGNTGATLYTTGSVPKGDAFWAAYPAGGASYADGVFQSSIPVMQTYKAGGFSDETFPMVAACGADRLFAFKNAAALLRIVPTSTAYAGQTISAVTVTAKEYLAGSIAVNYSLGGVPSVTCSGSKNVTVNAPSGIAFGTPIFVVVAPGSYTDVKVVLTLSSGFKSSYSAGAVTVDRSKFKSIEFEAVDSYTDLSASASANCYLIKQAGSYKFNASKRGNGVTTSCGLGSTLSGVNSLKVYYTDGETFVDGSFTYSNGYIYFDTVSGTLPIGTVLLSALDANGKTIWSWHIWSNRLVSDVKMSDNTTWLNMNVGAHQVDFNPLGYNGYYYQWGRKDPIQQAKGVNNVLDSPFVSHASQTDGSLSNSIANPLFFYGSYKTSDNISIADWCTFDDSVKYYDWWNKNITGDEQLTAGPSKTMFDPCPPGYHVPTYAELNTLSTLSHSAGSTLGSLIEDKLFIPCTSYRAAGITASLWNNGDASRGYIWTTNPQETGDKSTRKIHRFYVTPAGANGVAATYCARATALPVRCKKD